MKIAFLIILVYILLDIITWYIGLESKKSHKATDTALMEEDNGSKHYVKEIIAECPDLAGFYANLSTLLLEINESGHVTREIGLDAQNKIMHLFPAKIGQYFTFGSHGINDLVVFDTHTISDNFTAEEFNALWDNY